MQTESLHAKQSPRWQVETETVQPWKHWEKDRREGNFSVTAGITILGSKMFALKGFAAQGNEAEWTHTALHGHKNHLQARMVPKHGKSTIGWDMMCPKPG